MKRISTSRHGALYIAGPFTWLVRTRDNTAGLEVLLTERITLYIGVLKGRPVFEVEVLP